METPSVGPYPSREGHRSFYPQIPAHLQTWKLHPLAHIPPGRGTGVFIHGSLHISGHGNSIRWLISLQGGAPEFLSTDPCTFTDMETLSIGPYPSREGHQSFYPRIPAHLQTWKLRPLAHIPPECYDHALLVTGYDVLLSTLQGNLSFSTSSASSFASTHAGPDHFHLIDLRLRHHALSDSCLEPPSRVPPHGQPRSFDISTPLPP